MGNAGTESRKSSVASAEMEEVAREAEAEERTETCTLTSSSIFRRLILPPQLASSRTCLYQAFEDFCLEPACRCREGLNRKNAQKREGGIGRKRREKAGEKGRVVEAAGE